MSRIAHVISFSTGKDSLATLLLALDRCPRESVHVIFCDTGNEHAEVYAYLERIERLLQIQVHRLKADFSRQIEAKRLFIARDQRRGRRNGRRIRWSNKAKRRALAVLHPTGNPFLDLCLWKGRFPSRKAQFCTQELKTAMAVEYQLGLIDQGFGVISWQGVRRDESPNRRNAKKTERLADGLWAIRPLVDWSADDVFAYIRQRGVPPNPLYMQGMTRVGCMPCINVNKLELREIAARWPGEIDRIEHWEHLVSQASKRGFSTLSSGNDAVANDEKQDRRLIYERLNIRARVEWSRTTRGGKQIDLLADAEPQACASAYGLCG